MTIQNIFDTLILGQPELVCDCVFTILVQRIHRTGLSMILLSFALSLLTAPFHQNRISVPGPEQKKQPLPHWCRGLFPLLPEVCFLAASCRYFTALELIRGDAFLFIVLRSVQFDHKLRACAVEVNNVRPNDLLPFYRQRQGF